MSVSKPESTVGMSWMAHKLNKFQKVLQSFLEQQLKNHVVIGCAGQLLDAGKVSSALKQYQAIKKQYGIE